MPSRPRACQDFWLVLPGRACPTASRRNAVGHFSPKGENAAGRAAGQRAESQPSGQGSRGAGMGGFLEEVEGLQMVIKARGFDRKWKRVGRGCAQACSSCDYVNTRAAGARGYLPGPYPACPGYMRIQVQPVSLSAGGSSPPAWRGCCLCRPPQGCARLTAP